MQNQPLMPPPGIGLRQEKPMSIKFLVLGGVFWVLGGGGGSADFIFMGARISLMNMGSTRFASLRQSSHEGAQMLLARPA